MCTSCTFAILGTFFTPLWQPKATSQLRLLFALIILEDILQIACNATLDGIQAILFTLARWHQWLQIIDDRLLLWQVARRLCTAPLHDDSKFQH